MVSERPGRLALRMFDNDSLPASPPSTHGFLASPPLPHSVRPSVRNSYTDRPTDVQYRDNTRGIANPK